LKLAAGRAEAGPCEPLRVCLMQFGLSHAIIGSLFSCS
jgi:hypothetical protein